MAESAPLPILEALEKLVEEFEFLWIEREAYRQYLVASCIMSAEQSEEFARNAHTDRALIASAKERTQYMREALLASGREAEIEELLRQPSKSEKPN